MVGFRIPLAGFRIPKPGFRIPQTKITWIPDSGLPYMTWGDDSVFTFLSGDSGQSSSVSIFRPDAHYEFPVASHDFALI